MKEKFYIKFNKSLDKELVVNIYNRIINLPMSFFSMRTTGDVQARYRDGDQLRSTITGISLNFLIDIFYAIWALVLILRISWQMFIVSLLMQELMIVVQKIYQKRIENQTKELMRKTVDVDSFVMASFDASETIKNYNSENLMARKMSDKYQKCQDLKYKNEIDTQMESNIVSIIQNIGQIFMLGVLGIFVMDGSITIGNLVTAYMYVNYIFTPISSFVGIKEQLIETSATLERLDDVFRTTTEEEEDKKKKIFKGKIKEIEFDNVVFQYGLRKPVLKNINFKIENGESIGVIGESRMWKNYNHKIDDGIF